MLWIYFSLGAACFSAMNRLLIKHAGGTSGDFVIVFNRSLYASIPALALVALKGIPPVEPEFLVMLPAACLADIAALLCMSRALRLSPMGVTVPMLSFSPVFLLLTGFLVLGEFPSTTGLAGVVVIVIGSYCLRRDPNQSSIFEPFRRLLFDPGARWMFATGAGFAVAGPFFKRAVLASSPYFCVSVSLPLSTLLLLLFHVGIRRQSIRTAFPKCDGVWVLVLLGIGVFGVALTTNFAFMNGLVAYVVSIKRLSIVLSVLLGAMIFKERDLVRNLFAAGIMVAGAILIAIS